MIFYDTNEKPIRENTIYLARTGRLQVIYVTCMHVGSDGVNVLKGWVMKYRDIKIKPIHSMDEPMELFTKFNANTTLEAENEINHGANFFKYDLVIEHFKSLPLIAELLTKDKFKLL